MTTNDSAPQAGSPRGFGLLFVVVFALIGLWPLLGDGPVRLWSLVVAAVILVIALAAPFLLQPFNRVWHKFGLILGMIMTPVIMTVIFVLVFTPTGLLLRLFGKDPMTRRFEPKTKSYWIKRTTPAGSMRDQF